jgi:hypothetical protein
MSVTSSEQPYLPSSLLSDQMALLYPPPPGTVYYVDGTNGADTNAGTSWGHAFATIQAAVTAAASGSTIYVTAKAITGTDTDPNSYAETIIIPVTKPSLSIIGVSRGRTQGGLPQIKKGQGTTALLTIRAPGCYIANLGFNGIWTADSTQSLVGILLDDDNSTKTAWGTTIENCHFKNCAGSTGSTNAAAGGAITWAATGCAWQVHIKNCRFYKNVADIVLLGTSQTVPQDVIIENCIFSGPPANVDCNIYAAGSGFNGILIRQCSFAQLPNISSGTNKRYIILPTGTVGVIAMCRFACQTNTTGGTKLTFKASGTAGNFPTTVHIVESYGQSITASESGEITIA